MLIGRESVIEDFEEGLDNGAGAPGRLMLITGNRGCGKTVLLRELARMGGCLRFRFAWLMRPLGRRASLE